MKTYSIIGIMSGTSLDGIDISYCQYNRIKKDQWEFELIASKTYPYPIEIAQLLEDPFALSAVTITSLDVTLGEVYANYVNDFVDEFQLDKSSIDAIACHGQTVFHQPENGFTLQIGNGTKIAVMTGIPVINNFRIKDVFLGGQGAPLVPAGDFKLFSSQADAFLNIGGFCNISYKSSNEIIAFDVCPGNLPLNFLANKAGKSYDKDGALAEQGEINYYLLGMLNELPYYEMTPPKSLGVEWLEMNFYPLIKKDKQVEDNLRTVVEHIANQLANCINQLPVERVLVTGGGAKNRYLIDRLTKYSQKEIIIPSEELIDFKEAIIFGFLGASYLAKESNTLKSVTGASSDTVSGVWNLP